MLATKSKECSATTITLIATTLATRFLIIIIYVIICHMNFAAVQSEQLLEQKSKSVKSLLTKPSIEYISPTVPNGNINFHTRIEYNDDQSIININTSVEQSLMTIHDVANEKLDSLCVSTLYRRLHVPFNVERYVSAQQKVDLIAFILQEVDIIQHNDLSDVFAKSLLSNKYTIGARILKLNLKNNTVKSYVWWIKSNQNSISDNFVRYEEKGLQINKQPSPEYLWFDVGNATVPTHHSKFTANPTNVTYKGQWTFPYFSCSLNKWILSYSVSILPFTKHELRGYISIDVDVSHLRVNQCGTSSYQLLSENLVFSKSFDNEIQHNHNNDIEIFRGTHKCNRYTMLCNYQLPKTKILPKITGIKIITWKRGAYQCVCRRGFYSLRHPDGFNGSIMEIAFKAHYDNISNYYTEEFICHKCQEGCESCSGPEPCLAEYNWPFRISLLTTSMGCTIGTILLAMYLFHNRKVKVFKVASPIFLLLTLIGCAIMYLEMVAIFPYLNTFWCIATKWTRHMGFCITYTSLLMKTWRVSLTYRVKSAHKVKLTDHQLLQWMVPIILVMFIYLGTWSISDAPYAEFIFDQNGLQFKQCSYNWWDHSMAIGEVIFLAWGIRVCYNVRNAESMYNEAQLISYAIYNIAIVNITMAAIHLFIFPEAGPDIKYALGFLRIQLSTTITIVLVFGPKILRVSRGQGDKWDQKAKVRSITASFSLNGTSFMSDELPDLHQENEELKEQIQKLSHQIEFMKTVHMQVNNRHIKPKPFGYFTITSSAFQTPFMKNTAISSNVQTQTMKTDSCQIISDDRIYKTNIKSITPTNNRLTKDQVID